MQDAFWKFCKNKNAETVSKTDLEALPGLVVTLAVKYVQQLPQTS